MTDDQRLDFRRRHTALKATGMTITIAEIAVLCRLVGLGNRDNDDCLTGTALVGSSIPSMGAREGERE